MTDFWRQLDFFNPTDHGKKKIAIVGSGSVGSFTALSLSKLGMSNMEIYDDDKIEDHNIPNQFFRLDQIGKPKVEALKEIIKAFSGYELTVYPRKFGEIDQPIAEVVIVATDSMESRKLVWDKCKMNINVKFFIDCRMGGEALKVYTIRPCDTDEVEFYEKTLHSDGKSSELPCSAQTIIYNILVISGLATNQVKKVLTNDNYKKEIVMDLKTLLTILN